MVALVVDASACAKRIAEIKAAQGKMQDEVDKNIKVLADVTAQRGLAEKKLVDAQNLNADTERWASQLKAKEVQLNEQLGIASDRAREAIQADSNAKYRETVCGERENTLNSREAELVKREAAAVAKVAHAEKLLKDYDQAKHAAALKLAG